MVFPHQLFVAARPLQHVDLPAATSAFGSGERIVGGRRAGQTAMVSSPPPSFFLAPRTSSTRSSFPTGCSAV
ncbi:hypothetical protein QYE76_002936 [Lolium multiflorum]|uniref:Uncharacterized protein n=1 Tax=Lolium multiflorum TaxID=4521 RepID=A0AAD8W137_LOLMU|nr:hypothetical protein QYE76_002936 [Lolium multiflorum]